LQKGLLNYNKKGILIILIDIIRFFKNIF